MTVCQTCGATNPERASWCNQCLAAFAGPAQVGDADDAQAQPVAPAPPGPPASAAAQAGVRSREDGAVVWDCRRCGETASLADDACPVCGASLLELFAAPRRDTTAVGPGALLGLTALLPGAGHLATGRIGSGAARALLYTLWLAGGIAVAAHPVAGSAAVAAPLLMGAAALWLASLHDVTVLPAGGRQIAEGRLLLWLVVGVTGLALLGAVASASGAGLAADARLEASAAA